MPNRRKDNVVMRC